MTDPTPTSPSTIGLIAGREIRERFRATSYLVFTGLLVVVILAMGVVGRVAAGDDGPEQDVVGVTDAAPDGFDEAAERAGGVDRPRGHRRDGRRRRRPRPPRGRRRRRRARRRRAAGAVRRPGRRRAPGDRQQAWAGVEMRQALLDEGISAQEVDELVSPASLTADTLDGDDDEVSGVAVLAGSVTAIMLFLSLQTFGNYALVGVVEEKSSAVVELLLVRVRADELLAGKLLGIGVVALIQFMVAVVAGLGALAISGVDVPGEIWSALPLAILWFLGGYALYSTLFALAGSLVSRQEDAQAAAAPILTVLVAAYILVYIVGYVPDTLVSRVLSVLPPIAPFLMPMRMAAGSASVLEVVVAARAAGRFDGGCVEGVWADLRAGPPAPRVAYPVARRPGAGPPRLTSPASRGRDGVRVVRSARAVRKLPFKPAGYSGGISVPRTTSPWERRPGCPHRPPTGAPSHRGHTRHAADPAPAPRAVHRAATPTSSTTRIAAAKATLGDRAVHPRPPLPARRDHPLGRRPRRQLPAVGARPAATRGRLHRLLRRALHGRVGRHPHRRPPAGDPPRPQRRLLDGRHGRHRRGRGGVGGARPASSTSSGSSRSPT